jgi:hypothetical protein
MGWLKYESSSQISEVQRLGKAWAPGALVADQNIGSDAFRSTYGAIEQSYVPVRLSSVSADLTFTNNGSTSVTVHKTGGSAAWNASAFSVDRFVAPITIEFVKVAPATNNSTANAMIGFNQSNTTVSYTDIDYAAYPLALNDWTVYHNGSSQGNQGSWTGSGSTINRITYTTDGYIKHFNGSTQMYSVLWGTGYTVFLDMSFYAVNSTSGFSNIRLVTKEWNGTTYI